jgi:hypothetical protein
VAFRVDLRLQSPIIIIFRSHRCEQTTEQSRTLECNRNSRGEKSGQNGEKSCMRGEKSGENGKKYCMDTYKTPPNADDADKQSDKPGEDSDSEESCADYESLGEGEGDDNSDDGASGG